MPKGRKQNERSNACPPKPVRFERGRILKLELKLFGGDGCVVGVVSERGLVESEEIKND